MLRHRRFALFAASISTAVVALAASACSTDTSGPTPKSAGDSAVVPKTPGDTAAATPSPAPSPTSFSGKWSGTTAEGLPVAFTVAGDTLRDLSITIKLTGDCGIASVNLVLNGNAGHLVDSALVAGDSTSALSLRGTLANTNAQGSAAANYAGQFANGNLCHSTGSTSWTASKQ